MQAEVFLDTAYAIALSSASDQFHTRAVALAEQMDLARTRFVTTCAVLLEIGNALARQRYRQGHGECASETGCIDVKFANW